MRKIELRLNPLDSASKTTDINIESEILYDVVKEALESEGIKEDSFTHFHALVNGHAIEYDLWKTVKLEKDDIILISPRIEGGNFGQVFKQVAVIAVAVAANAALPGAGAFAAGTIGGALVVAGATIGATLLLNSVIPPPEPGGLGNLGSTTSGQDSSQMYNLAGQSNQTRRYGVVPKVYGTFRSYPNVAAASYVDIEADQTTGQLVQVLYVIYDFGLGPTYLEDSQIGTTPLDNFSDVQFNIVDPNRPVV
jgi:predicted phage tail protein